MANPLVIVRKQYYSGDPEGVTHGVGLWVWCPGCQQVHRPQAVDPETGTGPKDGPTWEWNGRADEGFTIAPSLLVYSSVHLCENEHPPIPCSDYENCDQTSHAILNKNWREFGAQEYGHVQPHTKDPAFGNCHSFIRDGAWQFLGDCAHSLAGQTVPMVPVPDWVVR